MSTNTVITAAEAAQMYDDYLDELYGVRGSAVVKALDPAAYSNGFSEYVGALLKVSGIVVTP